MNIYQFNKFDYNDQRAEFNLKLRICMDLFYKFIYIHMFIIDFLLIDLDFWRNSKLDAHIISNACSECFSWYIDNLS